MVDSIDLVGALENTTDTLWRVPRVNSRCGSADMMCCRRPGARDAYCRERAQDDSGWRPGI